MCGESANDAGMWTERSGFAVYSQRSPFMCHALPFCGARFSDNQPNWSPELFCPIIRRTAMETEQSVSAGVSRSAQSSCSSTNFTRRERRANSKMKQEPFLRNAAASSVVVHVDSVTCVAVRPSRRIGCCAKDRVVAGTMRRRAEAGARVGKMRAAPAGAAVTVQPCGRVDEGSTFCHGLRN